MKKRRIRGGWSKRREEPRKAACDNSGRAGYTVNSDFNSHGKVKNSFLSLYQLIDAIKLICRI